MAMNNLSYRDFTHNRYSFFNIITDIEVSGAQRALLNLMSSGPAEKYDCHVISLMHSKFFVPYLIDIGLSYSFLNMKNGYVKPHILI